MGTGSGNGKRWSPYSVCLAARSRSLEACEESLLTDAPWIDYQRNGDAKFFAEKHALFFRSVFLPSLAATLTRVRAGDAQAQAGFGDRLEQGLRHRLKHHPAPMHSFVHTIVLAEQTPD